MRFDSRGLRGRNTRRTRVVAFLGLFLIAALGTSGCVLDDDGPAEEAEDAIEESVDEAGDAVDEAAEETEDAVDEIEEEVDGGAPGA